jgi:hypothetical protein
VIFDSQGALYGTTAYGSVPFTRGTVFKLAPPAAGQTQWTETVLHGFKGGNDGSHPFASLILDSQGALYGTTCGGQGSTSDRSWGTVFKLMPPAAGQTQWTQTILHNFTNGRDGACPRGGVVFDGTGALYGTTGWGGAAGHGVVFKLQ